MATWLINVGASPSVLRMILICCNYVDGWFQGGLLEAPLYPLQPGVSRGPPGLSGGAGPLGPPRNSTTGKESRSGGLTPPLTSPLSSRQWELKLKKKRLEDDGTRQLMCMLNVHYSVHAPASSHIPTTSLVASIRQRISTYPIPSPATRHGIWSRTVTSRNLMHQELHWLDIPERVSYKHCSASWTSLTSDWQGAGSVQPLNSPLDNITLRSASPADDSTTSAQHVWQSPLVQWFSMLCQLCDPSVNTPTFTCLLDTLLLNKLY